MTRTPVWPAALLALVLAGCAGPSAVRSPARPAPSDDKPTAPSDTSRKATAGHAKVEEGIASYYAKSLEGRRTASGEPYRGAAATCAHRTHRFGTWLKVTLVRTEKAVRCRVNDRGPFAKGRIVDLSQHLARELGILEQGIGRVRIEPAHD